MANMSWVNQFPATAVSGPRQSGKSTLLRELFARSHRYVSFDDPVTRERARSDPNLFLDGCGDRIVFDEIQYVPEMPMYLKIRIDAEREKKGRYLLTSSQRFTLIWNLGDSLAGRVVLFALFPFSATEILSVPRLRKSLATAEALFVYACMRGMYPEPALTKMDVAAWYGSYLQTYLERDVRSIYDIGKRITKAPKLYFLDIGLVCHLVGLRSREHLLHGQMAGALFESFCVQETLKAVSRRALRPMLYYLRTQNHLEIDLLIETQPLTVHPI